MKVYAKNGTVASHVQLRRLRPDLTSGRSASVGATSTAMSYDPTFAGQSVAIVAFAFDCCGMLANFAFA